MESIFSLFVRSWRNYTGNFRKYMILMGIYVLPFLTIELISSLLKAADYLLEANPVFLMVVKAILFVLMLIAVIFGVVIFFSSQAAIYILVQDQKSKKSIFDLMSKGKDSAWDYFILSIWLFIFVFLWTLLFIVPGLVFMIYYSVAFWPLFAEAKKGRDAIKRSKHLVRGNWWAVFWRFFLLTFIVWAILLFPVVFMRTNEALNNWRAISNLVNIVLTPLFIAYSYYIYKDLLKVGTSK